MNLKKDIHNNKQGSYIVEAAITLPILIISICSMVLIIRIVAICESITFIMSSNLLDIMFGYNIGFNENTLCKSIEEISKDVSSFKVTKYKYLYDEAGMTDLIALDAEADFAVKNAMGINGNIHFTESILCRGFTGIAQREHPLLENEFYEYTKSFEVYVFPKYGEKYHKKSCRYIRTEDLEEGYIIMLDREDALRKGYTPCIVCLGAAYE